MQVGGGPAAGSHHASRAELEAAGGGTAVGASTHQAKRKMSEMGEVECEMEEDEEEQQQQQQVAAAAGPLQAGQGSAQSGEAEAEPEAAGAAFNR